VVASIIMAASAHAAVAMPADRTTLPNVVTPAAASSFSLFAEKSQAGDGHGALSLHVFGFERIAANGFAAPPPSYFGSMPSDLELSGMLDLPPASIGPSAAPTNSLVTDAVFGIVMTPSTDSDIDPAPIAFAALSSTAGANVPGENPVTLSSSAAIGLKFKLLRRTLRTRYDQLRRSELVAVLLRRSGVCSRDGRHRPRPHIPASLARRSELGIAARHRKRRDVRDPGIRAG
jgi:hypothetical protein